MGYVDLNTIHTPATGVPVPAAWGTQVRANDEATAKPPSCRVRRTTNQAVGHAMSSAVVWDTEDYDTGNIWVPGTPDTFTIPTAGKWGISFGAQFAINATGARLFWVQVGGTILAISNGVGSATWYIGATVYAEALFAAGDAVKLFVYQGSGATLNLDITYPIWAAAHLIAY